MKIQRLMLAEIRKSLLPGKVLVLYGPRQAGKTTLAQDLLGRAEEYFYSNKPIFAWKAYQWGMVNKIGWLNFDGRVKQTAEKLASGPQEAFVFGKQTFNRAALPNLEDALSFEREIQDQAGKTEEHKRMVKEFFARRK